MVKIHSLQLENVKRIKAVAFTPAESGLTVIGGKNGQGKTSALDAIAWALGGESYRPSDPTRKGSNTPPSLHIELSNGMIVERKGKNSALKVTDPTGAKSGQQILNQFVEQLAINLPKFLNQTSKEKAATLLRIIGVGDKLFELENREKSLYDQRTAIGRIADQKKKFAAEMVTYEGVPLEPLSAAELINQQQTILAKNGQNQNLRNKAHELSTEKERLSAKVKWLEDQLASVKLEYDKVCVDYDAASKTAEQLQDESTEELQKNIADIDTINTKIRANLEKEKAEIDAESYKKQYDTMSGDIEKLRLEKMDLLKNANLPLPGLSVQDGELTYNGFKWDALSGADQLKVSTAIVRKLNPECGFVLLDKLEQMDTDTLKEFGTWLESEGLQAIATRVSCGDECSIIIEDGYITAENSPTVAAAVKEEKPVETPIKKTWKAGEF